MQMSRPEERALTPQSTPSLSAEVASPEEEDQAREAVDGARRGLPGMGQDGDGMGSGGIA